MTYTRLLDHTRSYEGDQILIVNILYNGNSQQNIFYVSISLPSSNIVTNMFHINYELKFDAVYKMLHIRSRHGYRAEFSKWRRCY